MYFLLDWLATTLARVAPDRRNRLFAATPKRLPRKNGRSLGSHPSRSIHLTLRANPWANSGPRPRNACAAPPVAPAWSPRSHQLIGTGRCGTAAGAPLPKSGHL